MALSVKQNGVKQVPWFSLTEWHQVYKQIYSNETDQQTEACKRMLAWKARTLRLPVGVDCTLSIMQVCLRDREWTTKIDNRELPISYENDLCLMYSTIIMRFLNHISELGHTKQTSLFQLAKKLKIPEWIVNLRHDTAHGYNLPTLGVLRMATNILLTWIHDEYWAAEMKRLEEYITDETLKETQESKAIQEFNDLIEFWTAVSLYMHAGYHLVSDIPDPVLRETLQDARLHSDGLSDQTNENLEDATDNYIDVKKGIKKDNKYTLETARIILLSEISRYLNKKSVPNKKDIVCDALLNSEAFLPNEDLLSTFVRKKWIENELEIDVLPLNMMKFWEDIIFLLYEKEIMESLILELVKLTSNEEVDKRKRLLASLWISSIVYSFLKLDAAHRISRTLEYQLDVAQKRLLTKIFEFEVKEETERTYPHFKHVLSLNLSDVVLPCLTDIKFLSSLALHANEFSVKYILPILELVSPKIDEESKHMLLNLLNIYTKGNITENESVDESEEIFTLNNVHTRYGEHVLNMDIEQHKSKNTAPSLLADQNIRNLDWKVAQADYDWVECPIGILPWQVDSLEVLDPPKTVVSECNASALESEITPGVINKQDLKMRSQINWDTVLKRKKRTKRKHERRNARIIIKRALETAKKEN